MDRACLPVVCPPPSSTRLVTVKNTLASVASALEEMPAWTGVLAMSRLDQRVVFRRPPPYARDDGDPWSDERAVGDGDVARIRRWFEEEAGVVLARSIVTDAVRLVAERHPFHPVEDYLRGLSWDGAPRVDRWLEAYAKVRPEGEAHAALVRAVARKWLVSAVARATRPGCKVDTMLILEGRQGLGKSRALAALAGPRFFSDAALDFGSKDACQTIQGAWIVELAELDAVVRRDPSTVKAFLSRAVDRFRPPYGRAPEEVPRSVVFAGTVNHGAYLRDTTGNRRYWIVRCDAPLDVRGLGEARDQLWAEAVHLYRAGETWHLDEACEARMRAEADARVETDPWEESLAAWAHARRAKGEAPFTMDDVLTGALGLRTSTRNATVTARVSRILGQLGYERRRRAALPRSYHYVPVAVPPSYRPTALERSLP